MVFAIRIVEAARSIRLPSRKMYLMTFVTARMRSVFFSA
jgi:hypothetical protein